MYMVKQHCWDPRPYLGRQVCVLQEGINDVFGWVLFRENKWRNFTLAWFIPKAVSTLVLMLDEVLEFTKASISKHSISKDNFAKRSWLSETQARVMSLLWVSPYSVEFGQADNIRHVSDLALRTEMPLPVDAKHHVHHAKPLYTKP